MSQHQPKRKKIVVSVIPKNNQESPSEYTAKAFQQITTKINTPPARTNFVVSVQTEK
jgi:hypothetical protein